MAKTRKTIHRRKSGGNRKKSNRGGGMFDMFGTTPTSDAKTKVDELMLKKESIKKEIQTQNDNLKTLDVKLADAQKTLAAEKQTPEKSDETRNPETVATPTPSEKPENKSYFTFPKFFGGKTRKSRKQRKHRK